MEQVDAVVIVRCGVVRKRVAARMEQVDADVVVRAVVLSDVAVIRIVEINPSFEDSACPGRCEP